LSPKFTRTFWIVVPLPGAGVVVIENVTARPVTGFAPAVMEMLGDGGAAITTCVDAVAVPPLLAVAVAETVRVPGDA
jgi:hypothetical protein